ncbi:MAG: hypothetical protein D6733_00555 [Methanobacteriota archaeon]|nr:MAG: hypothetical protein D6733_00555 [Euryarchaeota archaeon]
MSRRRWLSVAAALLLLTSISILYSRFSDERRGHLRELGSLEMAFVAREADAPGVVDTEVLRYSDRTYFDLSINITNRDGDVTLGNTQLTLYFEGVPVYEEGLHDIAVPSGSSRVIRLEDVPVKTETMDEVLKTTFQRADDSLAVSATLLVEYPFEVMDVVLYTYRLPLSSEGRILLTEIFGGKTQEEAAVEVLKLN